MFMLMYLLGYTVVAVMLVTGVLNRHGSVSVADIIKIWLLCMLWPVLLCIAWMDDCSDYKWAQNFKANMEYGLSGSLGKIWAKLTNYKILRKQ